MLLQRVAHATQTSTTLGGKLTGHIPSVCGIDAHAAYAYRRETVDPRTGIQRRPFRDDASARGNSDVRGKAPSRLIAREDVPCRRGGSSVIRREPENTVGIAGRQGAQRCQGCLSTGASGQSGKQEGGDKREQKARAAHEEAMWKGIDFAKRPHLVEFTSGWIPMLTPKMDVKKESVKFRGPTAVGCVRMNDRQNSVYQLRQVLNIE